LVGRMRKDERRAPLRTSLVRDGTPYGFVHSDYLKLQVRHQTNALVEDVVRRRIGEGP
jgi:hypothetical protein